MITKPYPNSRRHLLNNFDVYPSKRGDALRSL